MPQIYVPSFNPALNVDGRPSPGAKMAFYLSETNTLADVFDADGDPLSQAPNGFGTVGVEADSSGRFPQIYLGDEENYRVVLRTAEGLEIGYEVDPYVNLEGIVSNFIDSIGAPSGSSLVGFIQAGVGAVDRTAQDKMRERVSVEDFGAVGDGSTDDSSAIMRAFNSLSSAGGTIEFANGKNYLVGSPLFVGQKNHVILEGNGSKLTRGFTGAASESAVIEFIICELANVRNLRIDGKNETYGGLDSDSHNIATYGCKRLLLENVVSAYAVCDGLYANRMAAGVTRHGITAAIDYLPEHLTLINFHADYNFRQGMSVIATKCVTAIGSSFNNTGRSSAGGTAPTAGVDLESNVGGIYTPDLSQFLSCGFVNNVGAGLTADSKCSSVEVTNSLFERNGSNGFRTFSPDTVARRCIFRANGVGGGSPRAQVQAIDSASTTKTRVSWLLQACVFEAGVWGDFAIPEGVAASFKQCRFEGGANFGIRVATNTTTRPLQGAIELDDVYIAGKISDSPPGGVAYVMLNGAQVPISIKNLALSQQIVRLGNTADGSTSVTAIQSTLALKVGMGVSGSGIAGGTTIAAINTNGSTITLSAAATATASNVTLEFSPATPVTTGLTLGTPNDLQDVVGVDFKGTGWVTKQDGGMLRAKYLANNKDDGVINNAYNLIGSATYDPPSLNDGDGATTTLTVTGAVLGDYVDASFSVNVANVLVTSWVSANNTVSVRFQNETGGVVDLGSGTLKARVWKG